MTGRWANSTRARRLPSNWAKLRQQAKRRAHGKCQWTKTDGTRCQSWGSECDHITPNDDHTIDNLQWLCTTHHRIKTQAEAQAAQTQARANRGTAPPANPRLRPTERHPGLLTPTPDTP